MEKTDLPLPAHHSLEERAAAYAGELNLSEELERDAPQGDEVW